jgi:hemerythrin-like domain-containing protein/tellurite resistance-related uncharacterized protein
MRPLPSDLVAAGRTALYTNDSMPASLGIAHRTTAQTWARINVLSGHLRYRTLDGPCEETVLAPGRPGVIAPEERHQVEPMGPVEFYLEFFKAPAHGSSDRENETAAAERTRRLRREHVNFHLLLDLLERQLDTFERAARPDYALMEDIVRYMREYPDRFHHPWEELIFGRLAEADARLDPVVSELKRQHAALARSGSELRESLGGAVSGVLLPRHALEQPGRDYIARFRAHMEMEEQKLFPLLGTRLADTDWSAIDRMMATRRDPLFGLQIAEGYERLYSEIGALGARAG